jgi:uncharacterized membrane protein
MNAKTVSMWIMLMISAGAISACSTREVASTAGGGAAGYEYSNKRAMDQLEEDYKAGRIDKNEYDQRKSEIESRSVVY